MHQSLDFLLRSLNSDLGPDNEFLERKIVYIFQEKREEMRTYGLLHY